MAGFIGIAKCREKKKITTWEKLHNCQPLWKEKEEDQHKDVKKDMELRGLKEEDVKDRNKWR